jgi:hypothetical protein
MKRSSCNPYAAAGLLAGLILAAILPACAPAQRLPVTQRPPAEQQSLTVLDARTKQPVVGALVFAPGDLRVFRSDLRGTVELPPEYVGREVRVHAKNHPPLSLAPGRARRTILLEHDESRINPLEQQLAFTRADSLRGTYGVYRANNDLLTYDLDIAVDVARRFISGTNTIRFRMLEDGHRIQLDLFENMAIDSIMSGTTRLSYEREYNAVFVDFPVTLRAGTVHEIAFHYSGNPRQAGRFGGMVFQTDSLGHPWVYTANQGIGASLWWPNKDQQRDEVDSMTIRVAVPDDLVVVSNGRFTGREEIGDGRARYSWKVHYPINNYSVSLNIGRYTHFGEVLGDLTLDYFVQPYHLDAARRQFAQVAPMLECFQRHFGDYPFPRDGFKLIEVPYAGMEHQSAVTYGNLFQNGYLGRDWTGVGISPRFDFIIVHESGHEWFGNSITANDVSDAWIQEGFTTYAEAVYVECMFGYDDAVRYTNGYRAKVANRQPIIGPSGVNYWPPQDQYFKGALLLHTLRHVVDDDAAWWALLNGFAAHFSYQNIWTTDVINYFNQQLDRDLRPLFEQYLYHAALPVLELEFGADSVRYRWVADVPDFDMPVKVRAGGALRTIRPVAQWRSEPLRGIAAADWQPATELFYIDVRRRLAVRPDSPASEADGWWKGNLHTHSLWSDGGEFPEVIAEWYRDHGYHFVAFTEHDILQAGEMWVDINAPDAGWPPRNASTRTALPAYRDRFGADWVIERREGEHHHVRLRGLDEYRHLFEEPGRFLLLMGEEITDRGGAHVNMINADTALLPQGGATTAERTRANVTAVAELRRRTGRPLLSIVNHPNYVWALTAEEIAAATDAHFFEVYNGHLFVNNEGNTERPGTERMWDVALTLRHAAGAAPLYGIAADDAHEYQPASDTVARPGRGWVMVRAARLETADLIAALEAGDFYGSTGVTLRALRRDEDRISIEVEPQDGVSYRIVFMGTRRMVEPGSVGVGEVLAEFSGTSGEYVFRGDERYVRATVVSSAAHVDPTTGSVLGQQKAWIQPVFR